MGFGTRREFQTEADQSHNLEYYSPTLFPTPSRENSIGVANLLKVWSRRPESNQPPAVYEIPDNLSPQETTREDAPDTGLDGLVCPVLVEAW